MGQYSVLVVDDDAKIRELLTTYFLKEDFTVFTAADGPEALVRAREDKPDIMVLDLMLPGMDGREVCRRVRRESELPILMLTAKDDETDRLIGLELGADDYVVKPFSIREVVARVRAILRRTHGADHAAAAAPVLEYGELQLDPAGHTVFLSGRALELTPIEFRLLKIFLQNPRRVFNRLQLMENTHGFAFDGYERTIDAHIRNLRRKIEPDGKKPRYIQTVYGIGYKLGGEENA